MKLEIINVTKKYGDKKAVDNLSLTLTNGVYALLGANGSGKTTLMRMIADVLKPTMGVIRLDGEEILKSSYFERMIAHSREFHKLYDGTGKTGTCSSFC